MKQLAPPSGWQTPPAEHYEKMDQIRSLSSAIYRAKLAQAKDKSYGSAANIQRLVRQRDELRGTMPPLRAAS
jgi:hypothetical protein